MLTGKLVILRAVEPTDYGKLHLWLNDSEVMRFWGHPGNTQSLAEIANEDAGQAARGTSRKYIIESREGIPIGFIDYYDLDWQARSVWVSILIGDQGHWGGGFGTDAMRTLLDYLFRELGLHRVSLTVHSSNERAVKSYEKTGFVREGVLRDWAFFDGQRVDGILMSILRHEFAPVVI
jgi:[ribosomal protein S5]-alanine N-acetyltransferase